MEYTHGHLVACHNRRQLRPHRSRSPDPIKLAARTCYEAIAILPLTSRSSSARSRESALCAIHDVQKLQPGCRTDLLTPTASSSRSAAPGDKRDQPCWGHKCRTRDRSSACHVGSLSSCWTDGTILGPGLIFSKINAPSELVISVGPGR